MSALAYRENVDALKRQVDELERLTSDETSTMDHILSKADRALGAQKAVAVSASSPRKHSSSATHTSSHRPMPPQGPMNAARPQQRSSGVSLTGTSRVEREKSMAQTLCAEGWDAAHVRAAIVATQAASLDAAKGWLQSMPSSRPSGAPSMAQSMAPLSLTLVKGGAAGSALNAARAPRNRRCPNHTDSPPQSGDHHSRETVTHENSLRSLSTVPVEPPISSSEPHKVSASATYGTPGNAGATTRMFEATPLVAAAPAALSNRSDSSKGTVSIQVRDPSGKLCNLNKKFSETDPLKAIVLEYFRLHPQNPSPRIGTDIKVVVPWLRNTYSHDQLTTVTLREASLCPTATVVLQIAKYA